MPGLLFNTKPLRLVLHASSNFKFKKIMLGFHHFAPSTFTLKIVLKPQNLVDSLHPLWNPFGLLARCTRVSNILQEHENLNSSLQHQSCDSFFCVMPVNIEWGCHPPRLRRWYITIPSSDQWCTTIENHRYQWLFYSKTIGKPLIPMAALNHSIQWWW